MPDVLHATALLPLLLIDPQPRIEAAPALQLPLQWSLQRVLMPQRPVAGAFGASVAMDEDRLWVGPSRDADVGEGPPQVWALDRGALAAAPPGAAVVAEPKFDRHAGFGLALAAARNACVAGAPHWGCDGGGCDMGQAYLISSDQAADGAGARWRLDEIACPAPEAGAAFGTSVAFDGATIVVASPRADAEASHAPAEGAESAVARCVDAGVIDIYSVSAPPIRQITHCVRLAAPRPQASGHFGSSVAVCGEWIAIGEPGARGTPEDPVGAGVVHLARATADGWRITESLRAPAGAVGWHGASVALAGVDLLIGAPLAVRPASPPGAASARGSVVHMRRIAGHWRMLRLLHPPDASEGSFFGQALSIVAPWAIVGAPGDTTGGEQTGAAWVIELATGRMQALRPTDAKPGERFGAAVAMAADGMIVIAPGQDPERPMPAGRVWIYTPRGAPPAGGRSAAGSQERSASAIAIAADASVTTLGDQPARAARSCASGP